MHAAGEMSTHYLQPAAPFLWQGVEVIYRRLNAVGIDRKSQAWIAQSMMRLSVVPAVLGMCRKMSAVMQSFHSAIAE